MRLVLTLPGLVAADPSRQAPALARLLAAAGAPTTDPRGLAAMLAAEYGIVAPADRDAPLAPILAAAAGATPGDAYWLVADPVTLVAGRDDVLLAGRVDDLAGDETAALLATLNDHFADDGYRLRRAGAVGVVRADGRHAGAGRRRRSTPPPGGRCASCCRRAPTRRAGAAGRTRSRCCCTRMPSTKRARRAAARP